MTSTNLRFDLLGPDDYDRAKSVLNKAKHPGFVGREQFYRSSTRGKCFVAAVHSTNEDVGVVLVDHKYTLTTLSVIVSARKLGVGRALVLHVRQWARFVSAIAEKIAYFESLGYRAVGAPNIGKSGQLTTQLLERNDDFSALPEDDELAAPARQPEKAKTPARETTRCEFSSLEDLLTSVRGFALVTATNLQRAIARIIGGDPLGELLTDPQVVAAVGDYSPCDGIRPRRVDILSGIRTGKSLIASAVAVHSSQTCDVSGLGPGEIPRVSVLSLDRDKAGVVVDHCLGRIRASRELAARLIGKPLKSSFSIQHPEEREIEVCVVAGAGAGGAVVSRWSAGLIADEAPRMTGDEGDAVANLDETIRAVEGRLLPGAQIITIGSPDLPEGPIYKAVVEHWHKPTPAHVVIKAPAWQLNPWWWTAERMAELTPEARRTDVDAEFGGRARSLFSINAIERCMGRAS